MRRCEWCGWEVVLDNDVLYHCEKCGGYYCGVHAFPATHHCTGRPINRDLIVPHLIRQLKIENSQHGKTIPTVGTFKIPWAHEVIVEAIPESGWVLDHWLVDGTGSVNMNPLRIVLGEDHSAKAVFSRSKHLILDEHGDYQYVDDDDPRPRADLPCDYPQEPNKEPKVYKVMHGKKFYSEEQYKEYMEMTKTSFLERIGNKFKRKK
jgi:hypothetical protein